MTFQGHQRVKLIMPFDPRLYHFLSVFCWHELSISQRFRVFHLRRFRVMTFWPLWKTVGERWYRVSKDNMQLYISRPLTRTLYLVSFPRPIWGQSSDDLAAEPTFDLLKVKVINWYRVSRQYLIALADSDSNKLTLVEIDFTRLDCTYISSW